jgi:Zn-dependent protease/predicted transcriptional regulator
MLRESVSLGSLFGIKIKLNWSVLVIFGLIVMHLALGVFPSWHPEWSPLLLWTVSLSAAVIFFLSLLAHEMAHSLAARAYGMSVGSITLFLFGGVTDIQEEPETPGREIVIAGVGPVMSLALGVLFLWWFSALVPVAVDDIEQPAEFFSQLGPVASVLAWVGPINILLAVFNLLPALPLDGGRIFRAILWKTTGDLKKATRLSASVARGFSWLLIGAGIAMAFGIPVPFLGSGLVGGLWLAVIGWFLGRASMASYTQLLLEEALEGVVVAQLVRGDVTTVPSTVSVDEVVDDYFLASDRDSFPVVDDARFVGIIEFDSIHDLEQDDWPNARVAEIVTPVDDLVVAGLDQPAGDALRQMLRRGLGKIPVVDDGEFQGLVFRNDIFRWIRVHSDTSVPGVEGR